MTNKFTLTLILAVVLISVIAFSACGVALAEEAGAWDKLDEKPDLYPSYPRLEAEATTPGFSGYVISSMFITTCLVITGFACTFTG